MVMIYLKDETAKELDKQLEKYNQKNAPTDRSGLIEQLLRKNK